VSGGGYSYCGCQAHNGAPPMPQRAATITRLPMVFEVVKAMRTDGLDWGARVTIDFAGWIKLTIPDACGHAVGTTWCPCGPARSARTRRGAGWLTADPPAHSPAKQSLPIRTAEKKTARQVTGRRFGCEVWIRRRRAVQSWPSTARASASGSAAGSVAARSGEVDPVCSTSSSSAD
jgi:hypothetical protein